MSALRSPGWSAPSPSVTIRFCLHPARLLRAGDFLEGRPGGLGGKSRPNIGSMPEYTYLLETRLSAAQQHALAQVRDAAREAGMVVFLAGGAVRDLTTGSSVRDLDFRRSGQCPGAAKGTGSPWCPHSGDAMKRPAPLFLWFPGSVRVEVSSTRSEAFPKPGKPVYTWSGIVDDLYRRDFTVNAMALSLNEGSYGLLLDPLNGVADTEARQLRLVSNYGFIIEDPSRLLRAIRLSRRMGWGLEERTEARYQNAKEADKLRRYFRVPSRLRTGRNCGWKRTPSQP